MTHITATHGVAISSGRPRILDKTARKRIERTTKLLRAEIRAARKARRAKRKNREQLELLVA